MKRNLLAVLGAVLLAKATLTTAQQSGDFTYSTDGSTVTITGYTGPGGTVSIPDTIDGLPVTGIGDSAFSYCTTLTSITIPEGITNIGDYAFAWCPGLTSITIPDSVAI